MNKKILLFLFSFSLIFSLVLFSKHEAKAYISASSITSGFNAAADWLNEGTGIAMLGKTTVKEVREKLSAIAVAAAKIAALLVVQAATSAIIGEGPKGAGVITDWNKYLYISPQQRAMAQMNSFFNTVSRGRLSSLNYEGIGPNYDAYLVAQARQAIAGQNFVTDLQDTVTDPSQIFARGNMRGLMDYMKCANNVACYTLTSTAQYNLELTKAQEIAKNEQQNGFLPTKNATGKITKPASMISSAFTQMDQLGTQVIMAAQPDNGQTAGALMQIAGGAGISLTARTLNYYTADSAGQAEIRNKNDQFPFSLAYSTNGGIGFSAGGVTASAGGIGAMSSVQMGNICATGQFSLDGSGGTVDIKGNKITCPSGSVSKITVEKPSIDVTLPSFTCTSNASCNVAGVMTNTFRCNENKRCVKN